MKTQQHGAENDDLVTANDCGGTAATIADTRGWR